MATTKMAPVSFVFTFVLFVASMIFISQLNGYDFDGSDEDDACVCVFFCFVCIHGIYLPAQQLAGAHRLGASSACRGHR